VLGPQAVGQASRNAGREECGGNRERVVVKAAGRRGEYGVTERRERVAGARRTSSSMSGGAVSIIRVRQEVDGLVDNTYMVNHDRRSKRVTRWRGGK
jgi:hypothetical protein